MSASIDDSKKLPFLSREWLRTADGVARHSLGAESVKDVLPEHRRHVLSRVAEDMERQGVVPPENWVAALSKMCGWDESTPASPRDNQ